MSTLPRITVHPSTVVFTVLLIILDRSLLAVLPFAAAMCHELGHIAVMTALGANVREIELTLFGAEIRTPPLALGTAASVAVWSAGAAANLISAAAVSLFVSDTPEARFFIACSVSLAAVNMLPIRTLDGGCALEAILERFAPLHAFAVMNAVGTVALSLLWLTAVYLLLKCGGSVSLMLFCMYLFASLYLK